VRWLSEHPLKVAKVILVAPWIDPEDELETGNTFFDFSIDSKLANRTENGITVFSSTNDHSSVITSVENIKSSVEDVFVREYQNAGHFCARDGYKEFPDLLQEVLKAYTI
jgi:predicted alpha/beta hydrolase family esterase